MEIPKFIPKRILEEAVELGGADLEDGEDLVEMPSFDKGSHRQRSLAHQPNHEKHWKKIEKSQEVILYAKT